jgi:hypothetical protein
MVALAAIVLVAGAIKFNFIDEPFFGAPVVYVSETGENIEAYYKTDDSVKVYWLSIASDDATTYYISGYN